MLMANSHLTLASTRTLVKLAPVTQNVRAAFHAALTGLRLSIRLPGAERALTS